MKKFKFRLQTVLEHRGRIRDEAKVSLLKANQALDEAQQELTRLELLELQNTLSIQEVSPVASVMLNAQIAIGLRQRIGDQRAIIVLREEDVGKAMEVYMESSKELKSVTTLKERKLQEYNQQVAEMEFASLDEQAIQRAFKRG